MELVILLCFVLLNGFLAASEIALVSSKPGLLAKRARLGKSRSAQRALDLRRNPTRFLSTVQVGITLVGILSGAFGEAAIAHHVRAWLEGFEVVAPYARALSLTIVVLFITVLSLVLGELVPKRIAMHMPERVACFMAAPLTWLSRVTGPVVWALGGTVDAILRLFGVRSGEAPAMTPEEILVLLEQGAREGVLEKSEHGMMSRILRLGDRTVGSVMTPRIDVVWLNTRDPWEVNRLKILRAGHSHFPVADGSVENVRGIVPVKRLLGAMASGDASVNLLYEVRSAPFVPENVTALQALEALKQAGSPMAIVTDEYGGLHGLVTLADIFHAIAGAGVALAPEDQPQSFRRPDGSWLMDGLLPLDDFLEKLEISETGPERPWGIETLGGFVVSRLGRIPREGDSFRWQNYQFEVVDMDRLRVDKVLVTEIAEVAEGV